MGDDRPGVGLSPRRGVEGLGPLAEDGASVLLQLPSGGFWQFSSAESTIALDDSLWVDGQSQIVATRQLVIQGTVPRAGGSFAWLLEKLEEQA